MKPLLLALLALAACAHIPHTAPEARDASDEANTAVHITVICGDQETPWSSERYGSGVIVSERHVLTAAHVVRCSEIPTVHVEYLDGRMQRVLVEREDTGLDIARLVISSADRFHLGVAPPMLGTAAENEFVAAWIYDGSDSRRIVGGQAPAAGVYIRGLAVHPGDSGAPVYGIWGQLLGLVSEGNGTDGIIAPVSHTWLEGT